MRNFNLLPPVGSKLFFARLGICLAAAALLGLLLHMLAGVHWSIAILFMSAAVSTGLRKMTRTEYLSPRWADDLTNLVYAGVLLNILYVWVVQPLGIQPENGLQRIALHVLGVCMLEYVVLSGINKYAPGTPTAQEILTGSLVAFVLIIVWLPTGLASLIVLGHGLWMNDATAAVLGVWSIIVLYLSISTILWWTRPGDIYRIKEIEYAIAQHLGKHVLHTDVQLQHDKNLHAWVKSTKEPKTRILEIVDAIRTLVTWDGRHSEHEKYVLSILRRLLPINNDQFTQQLIAAADLLQKGGSKLDTPHWEHLRENDLYQWVWGICYGPGEVMLPVKEILKQAQTRHDQLLKRQSKTEWMRSTFWYVVPVLSGEVVLQLSCG